MSNDTIFALSSGLVPSGVAIVRMSGPGVRFAFETMIGFVPEPRKMVLAEINGYSDDLLDRGLVVFFSGPGSFTGEDCGEYHIHGGRAVLGAVLEFLGDLDRFRLAEAGEFSRRAFENGRLDLTEVEGLSDLILANTDQQRKLALAHSSGQLKTLYNGWRDHLIGIRAYLEAGFDFSEEEDVPKDILCKSFDDIKLLINEISAHLSSLNSGEIIRNGFKVSIVGSPNSGKSSLLNALAHRDVAIVSKIAGTTRDVVSVNLNLNGYEVIISDTAGIRQTDDVIENLGIERTFANIGSSDLVIFLKAIDDEFDDADILKDKLPIDHLIVNSKIDLLPGGFSDTDLLGVSSITGVGLFELDALIVKFLQEKVGKSDDATISRLRHKLLLDQTLVHLKAALLLDVTVSELISEELRSAADQIGRIVGKIDVEDLLDVIFSKFCVGK